MRRLSLLGLRFGMTPAAIVWSASARSKFSGSFKQQPLTPCPRGSDAEQVRKGAHLAAEVAPIVATEIGVAREKKRRLTPEERQAVLAPLAAPAESGVNIRLSDKYEVSRSHISRIRNRHTGWTRAAGGAATVEK